MSSPRGRWPPSPAANAAKPSSCKQRQGENQIENHEWRGPHHLNPDERADQIRNNRQAEVGPGSGGGWAELRILVVALWERGKRAGSRGGEEPRGRKGPGSMGRGGAVRAVGGVAECHGAVGGGKGVCLGTGAARWRRGRVEEQRCGVGGDAGGWRCSDEERVRVLEWEPRDRF
jgi:hypothetical protein